MAHLMATGAFRGVLAALSLGLSSAVAQPRSEQNLTLREYPVLGQDEEAADGTVQLTSFTWVSDDPVASEGGEPGRMSASPSSGRADGWRFTLAPYLWTMSLSSHVGAGAISADADACFTDLVKDLDMGAELRFEARYNERWGFFVDGTYLGLSTNRQARVGPFKVQGLNADTDITMAWLDFGAMYRMGAPGRSFDAMLGGRYTHVGLDLADGPFSERKHNGDFVTPLISGRFEYAFTDRWSGSLRGDVGGFGVDNGAELYWGITALLGCRLSESATLAFGYRYYDVDYSKGRVDLDMQLHGPMIGLVFQF